MKEQRPSLLMTSKPHWPIIKQVRIWIAQLHHVGASFVSLAPTFLQKSERTHAAAHPFQITTAALGCDLVSPLRGVF